MYLQDKNDYKEGKHNGGQIDFPYGDNLANGSLAAILDIGDAYGKVCAYWRNAPVAGTEQSKWDPAKFSAEQKENEKKYVDGWKTMLAEFQKLCDKLMGVNSWNLRPPSMCGYASSVIVEKMLIPWQQRNCKLWPSIIRQ